MKIIWEVEDGYVGPSRPQHIEIEDYEIQECEDVAEALNMIFSLIDDDYQNNITWALSNYGRVEAEVKEILNKKGNNNE